MKPKSIKSLLALALLAPGALFAQTTAKTTPVGYVSLGNTAAGQDNLPNNTDIFVGLPLIRTAEWSGVVSSISGGTITATGAAFTSGQWVSATSPYIVTIESGAKVGLTAAVTSNTATELVLSFQPGDNLTGVLASDKISIRKAVTPASLFAGNTIPDNLQILFYEGAVGQNIASTASWSYSGGSWTDDGSLDDVTNAILYPGEGFVIRNTTGAGIADLTFAGEVPVSSHRSTISVLAPNQDSYFSYTSPVGEVIGNSSLSTVAAPNDQLLYFDNNVAGINKASVGTLTWDGSAWTDDGSLEDVTSTFRLQEGTAYVLRRNGATVGDYVWSDTPSYVPSL